MKFLKKKFNKKKKREKKENECWYNNAHEESFGKVGEFLENANTGTGLCSAYIVSSKAHQRPQ